MDPKGFTSVNSSIVGIVNEVFVHDMWEEANSVLYVNESASSVRGLGTQSNSPLICRCRPAISSVMMEADLYSFNVLNEVAAFLLT